MSGPLVQAVAPDNHLVVNGSAGGCSCSGSSSSSDDTGAAGSGGSRVGIQAGTSAGSAISTAGKYQSVHQVGGSLESVNQVSTNGLYENH